MSQEELEAMFEECIDSLNHDNCPFSKWEKDFILSSYEQYDELGTLSDKQVETLEGIYKELL